MIHIIAGTNRIGSRTLEIAKLVQREFKKNNEQTTIINLAEMPFETLHTANYGKNVPPIIADAIGNLNKSDGFFIVTPEYNGSYPGILKYFIDHFSYPETFEYRPVAFIGLGGRFGGLRPVEHLQQIFNYRNAYIFPERVFITNVGESLKDGELKDTRAKDLIVRQVSNFTKFVHALKTEKLDANSIVRSPKT